MACVWRCKSAEIWRQKDEGWATGPCLSRIRIERYCDLRLAESDRLPFVIAVASVEMVGLVERLVISGVIVAIEHGVHLLMHLAESPDHSF